MGKKGSWFSVLKRAFTSSSKDKDSEKRKVREKSRRSNNGEVNSFIPLYREPSSVEKILGDAEREKHHKIHEDAEREQQHEVLGGGGREQRHKLQQAPPKKVQRLKTSASKPVVTRNRAQISAIKIQAAYRGYMARRSYRALKGLVRLQGVMRGQSVKRQTMNTMRCMQLLVRVQSQIRARRMQMMEGRGIQHHKSDKEAAESSLSKWSLTHQSETEAHEEWEDSVLTKEEMDERMQRKVEAVIKRERALAYAYSHQLLKVTPKSAHAVMTDIRSGGYPWWWNWLERHLPPQPQSVLRTRIPTTPKPAATTPSFRPGSSRSKPAQSTHDHLDSSTPRSFKPLPSPRAKYPTHTSHRWQQPHSKLAADVSLRDDESLTSCPAFTVPRYMAPTASAKAKVRSHDTHEDGPGGREGKRRFAFGLGTSIGSLRWGKVGGSLFAGKDSGPPQRTPTGRHKSTRSFGGLSVDSTVSLPVGVGRKPFR